MTVPLKGRLASYPFPAIFSKITGDALSGVLSLADVETRKIRKRVGFKGGKQAYVSGGAINETLGRLMIKWKLITPEQYHKALSLQKEKKMRAGDAFLNLKIVSPQQLGEALQRQTEEKLLACFDLTDGFYSFIEAAPPADKNLLFFKISPQQILLNGIKRHMADCRVEELVAPVASRKLRRTGRFDSLAKSFEFKPRETKLLQSLKDGMTLPEILNMSSLADHETLKVLYIMITVGALEPEGGVSSPQATHAPKKAAAKQKPSETPQSTEKAPIGSRPPPQSPQQTPSPQMIIEEEEDDEAEGVQFEIEGESTPAGEKRPPQSTPAKKAPVAPKKPSGDKRDKNKKIEREITAFEKLCKEGTYFDLLGVERKAKSLDIKKAYFKLAKKFHPDTNPDFFQGDFKDRAEGIFTSIGSAYNTLIDGKARDEYIYALDHKITQEDIDKANKALEAEGVFIKAEVLFKKGDFRGARSIIEEAIQLNPDEPEYYVYLGWAKYKSSRGAEIAEARRDIQKALRMGLMDKLDEANYYLGMLAKVEGRPASEMEKYFAAAVEVNPRHTLASTELRHLRRRSEKTPPPNEKKKGGFFGRFKK